MPLHTFPPIASIIGLPPPIALVGTVAFVFFLFRRDFRQQPNVTGALWLPLIWMLIICSRQPSEWLNLFGFHMGAVSLEEGSPLDACVYGTLIVAGIYVLNNRQVQVSEVIRTNQWLSIFFLYCFLAIFWSDFPFVAFKRWIKVLGHPIMVLIILTEPDPDESLSRLIKRCAYVIVPISVLFIKYYPEWGRGFDHWTGAAIDKGIATDKNALGADCMILGFFFVCYFLNVWRRGRDTSRRSELILTIGFLLGIWWLFSHAHSSTSFLSCLLAIMLVLFLEVPRVNKRLIGTYLVAGVILLMFAQLTFDVWGKFLHLIGKDATLTDRTLLWHDLLNVDINPVFGTGFESFWLGERFREFAQSRWWEPNEAHNGYLETYLNLGVIGLLLLIALLIATFWKTRREVLENFEVGRFRLGFLVAIMAYNWTEASFKNISPVLFVFYLIAMDYPSRVSAAVSDSGTLTDEEQTSWVSHAPELVKSEL
jgi:O-antigen ligase